jgi:hypothetical protein
MASRRKLKPKRKARTLGNFAPGSMLEAMDETRNAVTDAGKAIHRGDCAEAERHAATADWWLTEGAARGFASKSLTTAFFDMIAQARQAQARLTGPLKGL